MNQPNWTEFDHYISQHLIGADPALETALAANKVAGLPAIDVSAPQGKLLYLFARMIGARRILEIGALGGYSTIWLARALPDDGLVVTLEASPAHADVARENFARAAIESKVDLRVGPALEMLPVLAAEAGGAFDMAFIDADKASIPDYVQWAIRLGRPGTLIVVDNVVRNGAVLDAASEDADIRGIRRFFDQAGSDGRLAATAIQTVGAKGWDGFALAIVEGN
jgi:predicted O-methyltransferase YrrM